MNPLKESVACLLKKSGEPAGTAFLVQSQRSLSGATGNLLLTCNHVITFSGASSDKVQIRFINGEQREATILSADAQADLAVLSIPDPLPASVRLLPLGSSFGCEGHEVKGFGFPQMTGTGGAAAKATILDRLDVQGMESLQLSDSKELTSGYSGGPIWDEKRKRVIGVARVVAKPDTLGKLTETAFVTTTECVLNRFPELASSDECPFKALQRFTVDDECLYKGRGRAIQSLVGKLSGKPPFLLLMGPSGSGKSSLVRAGLIPSLKRDEFPDSSKWQTITVEPAPSEAIREVIARLGFDISAPDVNAEIKRWRSNHPEASHLLVIIDQFERLFSEPFGKQRKELLG